MRLPTLVVIYSSFERDLVAGNDAFAKQVRLDRRM